VQGERIPALGSPIPAICSALSECRDHLQRAGVQPIMVARSRRSRSAEADNRLGRAVSEPDRNVLWFRTRRSTETARLVSHLIWREKHRASGDQPICAGRRQ